MLRKFCVCLLWTALALAPGFVQGQPGGTGKPGQDDQVRKIAALLKHQNVQVRSTAAFALGQLGDKASGVLEDLVLACGDESKEVQQAALDAIASITGKKTTTGPGTTEPAKATSGTYTVELESDPQGTKPNGINTKKVQFQAGTSVTIDVKTDAETNINLYFDDSNGKQIASDASPGKNCTLTAAIPQTGTYSIVVDNLGPQNAKCTVTYSAK
jgi:hypothetical protein